MTDIEKVEIEKPPIIITDRKIPTTRTIPDPTGKFKDAKIGTYDAVKKEYVCPTNRSEKSYCFRLVHDGKKVIDLIESDGVTESIFELYCGTEAECRVEIKRLKLDASGVEDESKI